MLFLNYKIGKQLFVNIINSNYYIIDINYFLNNFNKNDTKYLTIFIVVILQYVIINLQLNVVSSLFSKTCYKK